MAGIFPNASNGAVSPNNAQNAYTPVIPPIGTKALYYPNCATKIEGATLNAIISFIECAHDKAGVAYDPDNHCAVWDKIFGDEVDGGA